MITPKIASSVTANVVQAALVYAIDRDLKNWLAYNKFAYNETNSIGKLEDTFL